MNIKYKLSVLTVGIMLASCDAHDDHEPEMAETLQICDVVCSDGSVVRYDEYKTSHKTATAIVFYVNDKGFGHGKGYAVCLDEIRDAAFTDSIGVKQGTSCSTTAYDGNSNTYALFNNKRFSSPMAMSVNEHLAYGQSAYIPSVAQMHLLYNVKQYINKCLNACGGTILPDTPEGWYWTSTEVEGQAEYKAWLYSITSGSMLETNKLQSHRVRPVITIW